MTQRFTFKHGGQFYTTLISTGHGLRFFRGPTAEPEARVRDPHLCNALKGVLRSKCEHVIQALDTGDLSVELPTANR